MSQSNSESDIWEYKSLKRNKRQTKASDTSEHGAKKPKLAKQGMSKKKVNKASNSNRSSKVNFPIKPSTETEVTSQVQSPPKPSYPSVSESHPEHEESSSVTNKEQDPQSRGYCPVCQMPFSVLVVQSTQWHVAECLETPGEINKECPDGLQCSSTIPNHYKRYSHSFLAHNRAINSTESSVLTLGHPASVLETTTFNDSTISSKDSSVDSAVNLSTASSQSASPARGTGESTSSNRPNALTLLRSPGLEDIKKKKGWSPASKASRSLGSSQEAKVSISTPVKKENYVQTSEIKKEPANLDDDDFISYSPLSELPVFKEHDGNEDNDSVILFNDFASDDEIVADVLDQYDAEKTISQDDQVIKESLHTCDQLEFIESNERLKSSSSAGGADGQHLLTSSPFRHSKDKSLEKNCKKKLQLPSTQSLVLERLRECISNPASDTRPNFLSEEMPTTHATMSSTKNQNSSVFTKPKVGVPGLKQTDIGIFFGLKPLKEKAGPEVKPDEEASLQVISAARKSLVTAKEAAKRPNRRGKRNTAVSVMALTAEEIKESAAQPTPTEGDREAKPQKRKTWNRGRATDGVPKQCPFYKKIPGTSFAVDAFQYGAVEGITAYFLTHFHSDHYNGLTKNSMLPIYCNKITGNLVKSKLRVDEKYVHILPMNKECTVDGVKVILLDANHCPGSAMLLFLLPDGQTVLHTGDFRADSSMERYRELQSLRIQTLYLDTTYCSPEYSFPTQQEVISFAANTAFELITLNPRTLVVCGTYSVGKEKVFLAIGQVLGSKIYMSKEKYRTMCCLESQQICQSVTADIKEMKKAQVHVLPMMQLNFRNLRAYLNKLSGTYDQLVAFKPTGWTFTQSQAVQDIQPQVEGNISIYGIPYSEHSSFLELKRFVQWLRPLKIIPTVNVGSWSSRKAMKDYFAQWQAEGKTVNEIPCSNSSRSYSRQ
ncbi:DNA cross-link repair 1A protein [Trichomycterus rosablanca]|uniref:DNA cross-link repair 1A protein n=1 Tax=Trichomycterus rosablanca TaxID=2290929 RepID=UPI002F350E3B